MQDISILSLAQRSPLAPLLHEINPTSSNRLRKRSPTKEKIVLPSADVVETERQQMGLFASVNAFNRDNLKETEVYEKIHLPDSETIQKVKCIKWIFSRVHATL